MEVGGSLSSRQEWEVMMASPGPCTVLRGRAVGWGRGCPEGGMLGAASCGEGPLGTGVTLKIS